MSPKYQLLETDPERTKMMGLFEKYIKMVIINMIRVLRNVKKNVDIMRGGIEKLQKNQMKLLEMKNSNKISQI